MKIKRFVAKDMRTALTEVKGFLARMLLFCQTKKSLKASRLSRRLIKSRHQQPSQPLQHSLGRSRVSVRQSPMMMRQKRRQTR